MKNPSILHYIPDAVRDQIPEWIRVWLEVIHPGNRTSVPHVEALPVRLVRKRIELDYAALRADNVPKEEAVRILARKHATHRRTVYRYLRGLR